LLTVPISRGLGSTMGETRCGYVVIKDSNHFLDLHSITHFLKPSLKIYCMYYYGSPSNIQHSILNFPITALLVNYLICFYFKILKIVWENMLLMTFLIQPVHLRRKCSCRSQLFSQRYPLYRQKKFHFKARQLSLM
jgi:hypothetical protein